MLINEVIPGKFASNPTPCYPKSTATMASRTRTHPPSHRLPGPRSTSGRLLMAILLTVVVLLSDTAFAFNLSPRPNLVLREPRITTNPPKVRSSYFGFTLSLRTDSVIVGAPRAQSGLPQQQGINETGAIYKCSLASQTCEPYVFEAQGNKAESTDWEESRYKQELRNNQWLGAAMDGGGHSSDSIVVCAPRMYASKMGSQEEMHMNHGICYLSSNTSSSVPDVIKLNKLNVKEQQHNNHNESTFFYMLGEQGLSVNIADDGSAVLIGAPGIHTWKGSVVLIEKNGKGGGSHQAVRRDLSAVERPRVQRQVVTDLSYTFVPNPELWNQPDYSYLGYAVSSGQFTDDRTKVLYVASAPRANLLLGEVYIFLVQAAQFANNYKLNISQTLYGNQTGEYFGYALVTEDFNRDQLSDLAVAAPLHKWAEDSFDQGAVYIYENRGGPHGLELKTILRSEYAGNGRFGTALARIGDLNGDGYMDLAVGAPFEGQGAVYIYLGSANGLISKPSQRIQAPDSSTAQMMFGHGLSKGSDIDRNNYLDFAVGAPNAESLYVYKAYPVVSIVANVQLGSYELRTGDNSLRVNACWRMASRYPMKHEPKFRATIMLDPKFDRVSHNHLNQIQIEGTITENVQCKPFDVLVTFVDRYVFHPVAIEMSYEILDTVPDSEEFCENCVAVNPTDAKMVQALAVFNTGCRGTTCITDLKVTSSIGDGYKFVLGSTKKLAIVYKVTNRGESSFLTQLNVSTVGTVTFSRTPSECQLDHGAMLCDLHKEGPIRNGGSADLRIELDVSQVSGSHFEVRAQPKSVSDTSNQDNFLRLVVPITESSEVHVLGRSTLNQVSLEEGLVVKNITHTFEVTNRGPSNVKHIDVSIYIPTQFRTQYTLSYIPVIDSSQLRISCLYENQHFSPTLLTNLTSHAVADADLFRRTQLNGGYDQSIGMDQVGGGVIQDPLLEDYMQLRRRRRQAQGDPHTIHVRSSDIVHSTPNLDQFDEFVRSLPVKRTLFISCLDPDNQCVEARFRLSNFRAGNQPIVITVNFSIDLAHMSPLLNEAQDILVLTSTAVLKKVGDLGINTFAVTGTSPYTVISKYPVTSLIWIIIVSVLCGILLLTLVAYTMYRMGFFKRAKKEELEKFKRQSQALALQQASDNTDDD